MSTDLSLFAACLPGLEDLLRGELEGLGIEGVRSVDGGVEFEGRALEVYRANLASGLATHVLVRMDSFGCRFLSDLTRSIARRDWGAFLGSGQRFQVKASCKRSKLYHSGAVENEVGNGIRKACGAKPLRSGESPPKGQAPIVQVRVRDDHVALSLDTSGEPLHRRGWRLEGGKAPLREDLARALLLASGWDPATCMSDPLMGSGTIAIEAACMARRFAPGRNRSFAFENTQLFDAELYSRVRGELEGAALDAAPSKIYGSDRNAGVVEAAKANADRAGVAADLQLEEASFTGSPILSGSVAAPEEGALVSNPPHGRRIGKEDGLVRLYQTLGHRIAKLPPAWKVALCVADRRLALRTGLRLKTAFLSSHGGMKIRALVGTADAVE